MSHSDANCAKPRTGFRSRPAPSTVARACARYGVLVVGEEMKGSRAYWSQKLRPLGETVGLSRARTSGESPDSTQAGPVAHPARGNQRPSPLGYLLKADAKRYVIAATLRLRSRSAQSARRIGPLSKGTPNATATSG